PFFVPTHKLPSRSIDIASTPVCDKPSLVRYVLHSPFRSRAIPVCAPTHNAPSWPLRIVEIVLSGSPSLDVYQCVCASFNCARPLSVPTQTLPSPEHPSACISLSAPAENGTGVKRPCASRVSCPPAVAIQVVSSFATQTAWTRLLGMPSAVVNHRLAPRLTRPIPLPMDAAHNT